MARRSPIEQRVYDLERKGRIVAATRATAPIDAADIVSGTMDTARLGSGTANATTYLRGDSTWQTIAGSGDVVGPAGATDGVMALFDGVTGKLLKEGAAPSSFASASHTHPSSQISDSTAAGRSMLTAADAAAQTALLNAFTSVLKGLTPASGGGTSNFLRADGSWAAPPTGSGNFGATEVDFGAFPGASDASVAVTGQASIIAGSKVNAWIAATATADHSADEHWIETISVMAGNIVAGTGFTIYARNTSQLNEPLLNHKGILQGPGIGGKGTRLYGKFTVHWQWA